MRVEVYFNLHKHIFSVRQCSTGRVILHSAKVHIRDPEFVVRKSGRDRVLREGKKNVHAFVRGEISYFPDFNPDYMGYSLVSYNPYKFDTFVDVEGLAPVRSAHRAALELLPTGPVDRPYIFAEGARS